MAMCEPVDIRRATPGDCAALRALHALSIRSLAAACYDDDVIDAFITEVGTLDERLVTDGSYYAAFVNGRLAGCGGWTSRAPNYSRHLAERAPRQVEPAVRSLYVHPDFARRGIARRLMSTIEADIAAAGHERATLSATLNAIAFYRRLGYRGGEPTVLRMRDGLLFVAIKMAKRLGSVLALSRAA